MQTQLSTIFEIKILVRCYESNNRCDEYFLVKLYYYIKQTFFSGFMISNLNADVPLLQVYTKCKRA